MIGRLNQVALVVPDLPAATALYRDTLGASVSDPVDIPAHGVTVVFVQPQMSARQAQAIAQANGGEVAALDPLAADWAANLENAAKALRKGMAGQTEPK